MSGGIPTFLRSLKHVRADNLDEHHPSVRNPRIAPLRNSSARDLAQTCNLGRSAQLVDKFGVVHAAHVKSAKRTCQPR